MTGLWQRQFGTRCGVFTRGILTFPCVHSEAITGSFSSINLLLYRFIVQRLYTYKKSELLNGITRTEITLFFAFSFPTFLFDMKELVNLGVFPILMCGEIAFIILSHAFIKNKIIENFKRSVKPIISFIRNPCFTFINSIERLTPIF